MKHILTIDETTFGRTSQLAPSAYRQRHAVRAVLLDHQNRIYLMHLTNRQTYKLPGGGVDEGESLEQALARELMEEVGVRAEILGEIGLVIEYRDVAMLEQYSYCYLARQVGERGANNLEAGEIADGMEVALADDIDQAIDRVKSSDTGDLKVQYMAYRDSAILQAAKPLLTELI